MNVRASALAEAHLPDQQTSVFAREAIGDLSQRPKRLSPKYFYDATGSELFEAITRLSTLKTAGTNETAWNRPAFDAAFKRASAILDPANRRKAMAPLQELIANEGGYIIWSFIDSADLTSKKVNGIAAHPNAPLGNYDLRSAWLSG